MTAAKWIFLPQWLGGAWNTTLGKANSAAIATGMDNEDQYICVGICMADPDSGYCLGCGRPPLPSPVDAVVVEVQAAQVVEPLNSSGDPDTPPA